MARRRKPPGLAPAPPAIREGAPRRRVDCGETILQNSPCDPNIYIKPPDLDRDYSPRSKYLHVDPGPWQPFPSTAARCATWTWRITATDGGFRRPHPPSLASCCPTRPERLVVPCAASTWVPRGSCGRGLFMTMVNVHALLSCLAISSPVAILEVRKHARVTCLARRSCHGKPAGPVVFWLFHQ
jgi:hypothetical protein